MQPWNGDAVGDAPASAPMLVIAGNAAGGFAVRSVNAAFSALTGLAPDAVVGLSPEALAGPASDLRAMRRLALAMRAGRAVRVPLALRRADGASLPAEVALSPLAGGTGAEPCWIATLHLDASGDADRAALAAERDALRIAAGQDVLTGLLNRRGLAERCAALRRDARLRAVACFILDLDDFKRINDAFGHAAGDTVLVAVAQRLRGLMRDGDFAGRMGGDEFMLVTAADDPAAIAARAEAIAAAVSGPVRVGEGQVRCTVSVGTAAGTPEDLVSGSIARRADLALYEAKTRGAGSSAVFRPEMERLWHDRLSLRRALERGRCDGVIALDYLPALDPRTGDTAVLLASPRLAHRPQGADAARELTALARDMALRERLDALVLDRVARDMATAPGRTPVAVGISLARLREPGLVADIARAGLGAATLRLVLPAQDLAGGIDGACRAAVDALRARGIAVDLALDDQVQLPVAAMSALQFGRVVIDRGREPAAADPEETRRTMAAVVGVARAFGMGVLATGVGTAAQAAMLAGLGCDLVHRAEASGATAEPGCTVLDPTPAEREAS